MKREFRVPECKCPNCGKQLDAASNLLGDDGPEPGDVTICLTCGRLMRFTEAMQLRELTGTEMMEIMKDPRVTVIERARGHVMDEYKQQKLDVLLKDIFAGMGTVVRVKRIL